MKLSLNWIKHFTAIDIEVDKLIEKIGSQLGEVESVTNLAETYDGILVAKVVSCEKHPNADKLHVCKIDDGLKATNVERDENGFVQVVCGAPNVKTGLMVAWLPPGTTIPNTRTNKDYPIVMESKTLRDVISHGMLASAKELAIGDDHNGIVEIDKPASPGDSFAQLYELNDVIIDIENKMFTHRPDLFGELGLAREIAGINQKQFNSPEWYLKGQADHPSDSVELELVIKNEIPELVPRFTAQIVKDITVKPSNLQIQSYLSRVGIRPINNVVDLTNYYMMLTAQPLHAYDYNKLKSANNPSEIPEIIIRHPKDNETLNLLNGKTIKPSSDSILIADKNHAIGLGGIMGGADSEVDESTKNIVLECANFDMYSIRRTAMEMGLFTEATTRFNKGQSPLQNRVIVDKIIKELVEFSGGSVAGPVIDEIGNLAKADSLQVSQSFVNEHLGLNLSIEQMGELLKNVEFEVTTVSDTLEIKVPFWRTDIKLAEDIVEEIGRLCGYDKLNLKLPTKTISPAPTNRMLELKSIVRSYLLRAGANEVLTYSFIGQNLINKVGQNAELAFELSNPLSPDLQFYRLSLLPSLLDKVHQNIKAGFNDFVLYELNKVHVKGVSQVDEPDLPAEADHVALVFAVDDKLAKTNFGGAAYYQGLYYLKYLLSELGISFELKPFAEQPPNSFNEQLVKPFEPNRSSQIYAGSIFIGAVGEPTMAIKSNLKLPKYCAIIELDTVALLQLTKSHSFIKISHYPKVSLDICLKVSSEITYQALFELVLKELNQQPSSMAFDVSPIDIYQSLEDPTTKQITFRVEMHSQDKTLTIADANEIIDKIGQSAVSSLNAQVI